MVRCGQSRPTASIVRGMASRVSGAVARRRRHSGPATTAAFATGDAGHASGEVHQGDGDLHPGVAPVRLDGDDPKAGLLGHRFVLLHRSVDHLVGARPPLDPRADTRLAQDDPTSGRERAEADEQRNGVGLGPGTSTALRRGRLRTRRRPLTSTRRPGAARRCPAPSAAVERRPACSGWRPRRRPAHGARRTARSRRRHRSRHRAPKRRRRVLRTTGRRQPARGRSGARGNRRAIPARAPCTKPIRPRPPRSPRRFVPPRSRDRRQAPRWLDIRLDPTAALRRLAAFGRMRPPEQPLLQRFVASRCIGGGNVPQTARGARDPDSER